MKLNTSNHLGNPFIAMMAGLVISATTLSAQTTLFSADFETPDITGYTQGTTPTGWVRAAQGFNSSFHGLIDQDVGGLTLTPPSTQAYAFRYTNSGFTTAAGVIGNLSLGVSYTVSAEAVRDVVPVDGTGRAYTMQLLAVAPGAARDDCRSVPTDSAVLGTASGSAPEDGSVTPITINFTPNPLTQGSLSGYDLAVRFIGATNSAIIDNVTVTADFTNVAFWDTNGGTTGSGGASPSGTWSSLVTNWNAAADGTGTVGGWTTSKTAVFAAGTDAVGSYNVTINGTQDINGLIVEEGTVSMINGAAGALNMTAPSPVFVASGSTVTIGTPITDADDTQLLQKAGAGLLVLSADNSAANGGIQISAGAIQFNSPASINGSAMNVSIDAGGTLIFGPAFGSGNISAALTNRVVDASSGTIAADNYASTAFDFATALKNSARLGAVGSVTYSGTLTPQGATYRLGGGGGTLTMANTNALTGVGNSAVISGNVTLAGANDLDGGITLNSGLLKVGNNGSLGSGTLVTNGGRVSSADTTALTLANALDVNANLALGDATNTGKLTFSSGVDISGGTRTFTTNSDVEFAGIVSGANALTKAGPGVLTLSGANTYNGTTTASGGTLVLSGSNNSAGATVLNAATLQLNSNSNGGLASGQITMNQTASVLQAINADRVIANNVLFNSTSTISGSQSLTINGNFNNNNNRILTNSITGTGKALTLANVNLSSNSDNRTLTFAGNGDTIISGIIANGGTSTASAIIKNGNGTLTLTNTNTYGGNTTINNAGTLVVNGSTSTGAVNVNGTGTLGGSGSIGGNVTVTASANLAPGASAVGTLAIGGNLTISAMAGGEGKLLYELGPIASSDRVNVTGTLAIGDGALGFSDFDFTNVGGLQEGTYTLITSGTLNGTLNGADVEGTIGGFDVELQTSGGNNIVLVVGEGGFTGYALWASVNAPIGGPADDFDGDGVSNAIEFVLGGDKDTSDLGKLPSATTTGGNLAFTFVRDQDSIDGTTSTVIEVGTTLASWPIIYTVGADTAGSSAGVSIAKNSPGVGLDTVTLTLAQAPDTKKFARLKVLVTP